MGSDKSKKRKKHKHKRDHADSGSDSSSASTSGSSDEQERRSKKHKKDKSSKHKHKHSKHKSVDKALVKQAKEFLKQQLTARGATTTRVDSGDVADAAAGLGLTSSRLMPAPLPRAPRPAVEVKQPITAASYFERNAEFTSWLLEERRVYFNELTADQSRMLFDEFVEQWNAGQLNPNLYNGNTEAPKRRTSHVWSFKGAASAPAGPVGVMAFLEENQRQREMGQERDKQDRRNARQEREGLLDELLPKATGREAVMEKKAVRREEAHARGASPDITYVPGGRGDLMGGDDSFEAAKAREARSQQFRQGKANARNAELNVKLAAFQAAEDAKMAQFRALVNQGPITIAKRQPPPAG